MLPDHLETNNLELKPFGEGDANAVFDYWQSDPGWERFNESVPSGFTLLDAQKFVAEMRERDRHVQPHWALVNEGAVVGVVSLTFGNDFQSALIGYGIHARLRGRGFTVEAVTAVITEAFKEYAQLERVLASTDPENVASIRVLKKLRFAQLGEGEYCLGRQGWL